MLAVLLFSLLQVQDDVSKWIDRLDSDSIDERQEAARRLQAMGPEVEARLEKARDAARTPELRLRLDSILTGIRKGAELAKVFGPTRRVTIAARGRPLKEILSDLRTPQVRFSAGMLDEEARFDLQVRNVTWWEAVDRAAKAASAWYTMEWNDDGTYTFEMKPKPGPESPVLYVEQFRISVAESKRVDYRTPAGRVEAALVTVEVRHQADLRIPFADSEEFVRIDSVVDSKGNDVRAEERDPIWMSDGPLILCQQGTAWVKPDASLPLTVSGTTDLPFASDTRQVELDLEGERSRVKIGAAALEVAKSAQTRLGFAVTIKVVGEEVPFLYERLNQFSVVLVDSEGRKHTATPGTSSRSGETCTWDLTFTTGIEKPRRVIIPWIADFHRVQIPFRLEGVRLPDLK